MAELDLPPQAIKVLSILLIITGLAVYVVWGIYYGSWNFFEARFIPVYGIVAVLLMFGVLGLLLVRNKE
jgi:hypothetical protein